MGTISKNFSYHEFEHSDIAKEERITNAITSVEIRDSIKDLVDNLLQPLRDAVKKPLKISSGYRCPQLNSHYKIGGSPTSQHVKGEAADVWCATMTPYELACKVVELGLKYDQMILYPGFVHLSYKKSGAQRMQILYNMSYKGEKINQNIVAS